MKVTFGTTVLAAGGREGARNFRPSRSIVVQAPNVLRATAGPLYSRGNARTTVTFEVTRLHATLLEACEFVLMHTADLPVERKLATFTTEGADGSASRYLRNAVLGVAGVAYKGVSSIITYTITGGLMSSTPA